MRHLVSSLLGILSCCMLLSLPAHAHGDLSDLLDHMEGALARDPGNARLWLERGELHRLQQDWDAASADYARAETLGAGPRAGLCRAALDLDRGRLEDALERSTRACALAPEDPEAAALHARVLRAMGREGEALADLEVVWRHARHPAPSDALDLARLQSALGEAGYRQALATLEEAIVRLGPVEALVSGSQELRVQHGDLEGAYRMQQLLEGPPPLHAAGGTARGSAGPQAIQTSLLARNSVWKFNVTPGDSVLPWNAVGFNDAGWASGPGILGFGETYIATTVPSGPANNVYRTTWFRIHFNLGVNPAALTSFSMSATYDDGFVAYLNGQEVARRSMPSGTIRYSTFAFNHEGGSYAALDLTSQIPKLVQGDNVLAVEVHQTSLTSSDLVWDCDLDFLGSFALTRGPYLQNGAPDAVTVRWRTNTSSDSQVKYGPAPDQLVSLATDATATTEHEVRIGGLQPYTRYYYSVGSTTQVLAGGDSTFWLRTSPTPGARQPWRIWAIGDAGWGTAQQAQVRDAYAGYVAGRKSADVWLMLGDNAYSAGTDGEYQTGMFNIYPGQLRNTVCWSTRGNHDLLYAGANNDYYDLFTLPSAGEAGGLASGSEAYYSFDYGNIHFVCLDSEGGDTTLASPMLGWLESDLSANSLDWTIAYWHHPPYTKGSHDSDNEADSNARMGAMRRRALPILEAHGVDLVLCGHSHVYERSVLVDGHYGYSTTLTPANKLDPGNGQPAGTGAYQKPSLGPQPRKGEVCSVVGSSGTTSGGTLNHPVMVRSLNVLGSMVVDVSSGRLDARFLDNVGAIQDSFTILKAGNPVGAPAPRARLSLQLEGSGAIRGGAHLRYSLPAAAEIRISVFAVDGRRVCVLESGPSPPGEREVFWDGSTATGADAGAGVFFALLETNFGRRLARMVRVR